MKNKREEIDELLERNQEEETDAEVEKNGDAESSGGGPLWYGGWNPGGGGSGLDSGKPSLYEKKKNAEEKEAGESGDGASKQEEQRQLRGLYRYVKISVPTLNKIILVLCILLVICMIIGISGRGYLITFDSLGGTTVESQKRMYGELVEEPEDPYREGYNFTGWYKYEDGEELWDMESEEVTEPMTLYAGWEEKP